MTKIMEADGTDVNMLFPTPEEDSGEDGTEETAFECAAETGQQPGWLAAPADFPGKLSEHTMHKWVCD